MSWTATNSGSKDPQGHEPPLNAPSQCYSRGSPNADRPARPRQKIAMLHYLLTTRIVTLIVLAALATTGFAKGIRQESLDLGELEKLNLVQGSISGREVVDYQVTGERSQILSIDLLTSNLANHFNVLPSGSDEALFIGSTQGTVADVRLPESGAYLVRVYLMRSAARRGETADYSLGITLGRPEFADGLSGGPDYWSVSAGAGFSLNLRAGPSTRYAAIGKLRNGDVLQNRGCRLTGNERWCAIRAAHSGVTGWVAGRYLVESAAPKRPSVAEGGPVGNGVAFDATGFVPCAAHSDQPMRQCPFGVIREGPGNAGIWIALGGGEERQILFERGIPVTTDSVDTVRFEKTGDLFMISVGEERFEIPDAVVAGG